MSQEAIFLQAFVNAIMMGSILVLIGLGLSLVFGIMGIVNLAHGEMYMLGAYGLWWFFNQHNINFFLAIVLSVILVSTLGIIIERFLFKPVRGDFLTPMIVAVGLILILQTSALLAFGIRDKGVYAPEAFQGMLYVFGSTFSKLRLSVMLVGGVVTVLLYLFIKRTKIGQAMQAVAQDAEAAAAQGISIDLISSLAMGIGCGLAAMAGCMMGCIFYINPYMGSLPLIKALVVIVLGGLGSIPGTIVGGLIIGFVDSFGSTFISTPIATMLVFLVLVIVLLVKPTGLFGLAE
jgi:branched-chain amino acid transport system permease protein